MSNTKICSKCKEKLPLDRFSKNPRKKDGLNYNCRKCAIAYLKEHYKKNKQYYKDKAKLSNIKQTKRLREIIRNYKVVCCKCGENHPAALDFHHKNPEEKLFTIGQIRGSGISTKRLINEIEKCDVICANCHRKLHYTEKYGEQQE